MAPPLIFISYSRQDAGALDKVVSQLRVLETQGLAQLWIDQRMELGEVWRPAIGEALDRASIAILLVSENFLGSEFINKHEVPRLLERSRHGNLHLIPVLLSPCDWQAADWLEKRNLWPGGAVPLLTGRSPEEIQSELAVLTRRIRALLSKQEAPAEAVPGRPLSLPQFLEYQLKCVQRTDWEENWSATEDQPWRSTHFTDLEAEVELEEKESRFRRNEGARIRREPRLARALVRSTERFSVLEGAPGAGKSVVLRHVTQELLKEARRAAEKPGHRPIQVALYLSLRGFRPKGRPDEDAVRSFILDSLGADAALLSRSLGGQGSQLHWRFLFDSFDEIPAVLSSAGDDNAVRDYAYALNDFISRTPPGCSAIVASRHFRGPTRFGWTKYRLLPLGDEQRARLTKSYLHEGTWVEQVLGWLDSSQDGLPLFGTNPLMLAMLCAWFRSENKPPGHPHEVFTRFFDERLLRHADDLRKRGFTAEDLRKGAEALAFCMSADASLGMEPARVELAGAMRRHGLPVESLPEVLEALCELRVARRGAAPGGQPSFAFVHRRFQEFFSTRWVQAEPQRVLPESLFSDHRWRETCVVLLQTASGAFFQMLLTSAEEVLDEALAFLAKARQGAGVQASQPPTEPADTSFPQSEGRGVWPEGVRHLLELLQEGLRERLGELPDSLTEKVATLVRLAYDSRSLVDQRDALEVAGLLPAPALEALLASALRSRSQVLADAAYRQASSLRQLPAPVASGIREILVEFETSNQLPRLWWRTKMHVSRLPESSEFIRILRLLRLVRPIRAALYFLWLSTFLVLSSLREQSTLTVLAAFAACFWSALHLSWSLQKHGVKQQLAYLRWLHWAKPRFASLRSRLITSLNFIAYAWLFEAMVLLMISERLTDLTLVVFSSAFLVTSWDAYAYLACLNGKWTSAWFLYPLWPGLFPSSILPRIAWKDVLGMATISLALLSIVWASASEPTLVAGGFGTLLALLLIFPLVQLLRKLPAHIHRVKRWQRVEQIRANSLTPQEFIHWLEQFELHKDRIRFIRMVRTRNAVRPVETGVLSNFIASNSSNPALEVEEFDELYWLLATLKAKQDLTIGPHAPEKRSVS